MASNDLTDVELSAVHCGSVSNVASCVDPFARITEDDIETDCGLIRVAVHGDRKRRALFTYHDLGTNYQTCFRGFFSHPDMHAILEYFCVYHINAPGHIPDSVPFAEPSSSHHLGGQVYPSLEQLAMTIGKVAKHYEVTHFVGFGLGLGANLFCRFHLANPEMTDGLILVNANVTAAGWIEWGWFKLHNSTIHRADQFQTVVDYLTWHWFGEPSDRPHDLVLTYLNALKSMNRECVSGLVSSFVNRSDMGLTRGNLTLKCNTLLITGDTSPHIDAVVETNSRLDPTVNNFLKLADCGGMILDEVPGKVCEAVRLFLQGQGFFPALRGHTTQESQYVDSQTTVPKSKLSIASSSFSVSSDMI